MIIDKKYQVFYIDPPWSYNSKAHHKSKFRGGAIGHYPLMSMKDIKNLDPAAIAAEDSVMFLWATYPLLPDILDIMKNWGWTYKTTAFTWIKLNKKANSFFMGCGCYSRSNSEIVLLGTRGKVLVPEDRGVSSIVLTRCEEHSRKPDEVRNRITRMYPNLLKTELFATKKSDDWDSYGLDLDGQDAQDYLKKNNMMFRYSRNQIY